jgi:hypothetical protein
MGDEVGAITPVQKPDKVAFNNRLSELDIELKKQQTRREQLIARIANVKVAFDESNVSVFFMIYVLLLSQLSLNIPGYLHPSQTFENEE